MHDCICSFVEFGTGNYNPDCPIHTPAPARAEEVEHPYPWRIEQDWTWEVLDAKGGLVCKCPNASLAELIVGQAAKIEHLLAYAGHERSLGAEGPMIELQSERQCRIEAERRVGELREALREIVLSGSPFDAKGTHSKRIHEIATKALGADNAN